MGAEGRPNASVLGKQLLSPGGGTTSSFSGASKGCTSLGLGHLLLQTLVRALLVGFLPGNF